MDRTRCRYHPRWQNFTCAILFVTLVDINKCMKDFSNEQLIPFFTGIRFFTFSLWGKSSRFRDTYSKPWLEAQNLLTIQDICFMHTANILTSIKFQVWLLFQRLTEFISEKSSLLPRRPVAVYSRWIFLIRCNTLWQVYIFFIHSSCYNVRMY